VIHGGLMAYIGPGAGFAFLGSFLSLVLALLAGIASAVVWPFRMVWAVLTRSRQRTPIQRAIFLGFDGLDPAITERMMAEGKLPNLARLREQGSYRRLRTTFPALSPVAWSTFATGVNPAKHNIFDFLRRDLRNYALELSSAKVRPAGRFLRIGKWRFPLSRATVEMRRKSEPFWKTLGRHQVKSTILRVPLTFPPEAFHGLQLSAMCTPDLLGTQGTYSRFTASEGALQGPDRITVGFRVQGGCLEIQGKSYPLLRGEYTPWIRLKFGRVRGIVRFLLSREEPELDLYATPVQIDPENPALPISHPPSMRCIWRSCSGLIDAGPCGRHNGAERGRDQRMPFCARRNSSSKSGRTCSSARCERTRRGVVACVFDTTDRVQHMFHGQPGRD
jgi:hypothetical protein